MAKKWIVILILVVMAWWGYGFVTAIMDHRAKTPQSEMTAKMEKFDPIRKSGYRTYANNFTKESDAVKALREVLE